MRLATTNNIGKRCLKNSMTEQNPGSTKRVSALCNSVILIALTGLLLVTIRPAQAQNERVIHSFKDACQPFAGLTIDANGNLYGTTAQGGKYTYGVIFKVTPSGEGIVLHNFNGADGADPSLAGVWLSKQGNLYGTTEGGGGFNAGVVFELAPSGTETVLHYFDGSHGGSPFGGVIRDGNGNLYGTTAYGGPSNKGTVFKLGTNGNLTVLHSFRGSPDGDLPVAGLVRDRQGNLYGTTGQGGKHNQGSVFKVTPSGKETVLHSFQANGIDGAYPQGALILDGAGNLYGTTSNGGSSSFCQTGCGAVFELTPSGTETVLHSFEPGDGDGTDPHGALVRDEAGNLYGTTYEGGAHGRGTVFELTPAGAETVLHSFQQNGKDGTYPVAGLVLDASGNLYGTTSKGGKYKCGTVFEVVP